MYVYVCVGVRGCGCGCACVWVYVCVGVGVRVCGCGCTCLCVWVYVCVGGLCVGEQGVSNCESTRVETRACEGVYSCVCEMGARMLTRVNTRLVL